MYIYMTLLFKYVSNEHICLQHVGRIPCVHECMYVPNVHTYTCSTETVRMTWISPPQRIVTTRMDTTAIGTFSMTKLGT